MQRRANEALLEGERCQTLVHQMTDRAVEEGQPNGKKRRGASAFLSTLNEACEARTYRDAQRLR